jgi:hypothetical protein
MPADEAGQVPVVAEDRAQPGGGHRLSPVRALRHQEQPVAGREGPFHQQIHLDDRGDVGIQRNSAFPLTLTDHSQPPEVLGLGVVDVDIGGVVPAGSSLAHWDSTYSSMLAATGSTSTAAVRPIPEP